jgi:hypothetical protein
MRSLSDLFRNFVQLAYVTNDVDAAAEYFESALGTGKCVMSYHASLTVGRTPTDFVVVDGTPAADWTIDVALVNVGPTNLEIIRPVSGAVDLYRDGVRPGEPVTFHHAGFVVDDFDEADAVVKASGKTWKQYGASGDIRFGYIDMRAELGHFVEVMELGEPTAQWMAKIDAASASGRPLTG